MEQTLIEQSITQYRKIIPLSMDIERAIRKKDVAALTSLCAAMSSLQEAIKGNDGVILDLLRHRREVKKSPQLQELVTLMQHIHEHNQRLTPQIMSIMAVQRDELQKLKQGNRVLQGYRPALNQTGKRICSSN